MPLARAAALLCLVLAACGYRVVTPYRARGGVDHIHVRAFENDSGDPELGAAATAALRDELARRGASAAADAPAQLEGSVRVTTGVSASYFSSAANVGVEIHARLSMQGKLLHEVTIQRAESHPGGADPLESEGRRSGTLRKLARDAAREVIRELEQPAASETVRAPRPADPGGKT
ncbi:MAG TPA: LPS assembly lipoprotein LptE [Anaeromyxobacter sp.]|nr:LPS assembly lipoprotein LptE [Anaeromyxobacter sp.]